MTQRTGLHHRRRTVTHHTLLSLWFVSLMQDLCLNYFSFTNESVWDWFSFITAIIRTMLLMSAMIRYQEERIRSYIAAVQPVWNRCHKVVDQLSVVCAGRGLCMVLGLIPEVLLRSWRCVGGGWMSESFSPLIRGWQLKPNSCLLAFDWV